MIKKIIKTNLLAFALFIICFVAGCTTPGMGNKLTTPELRTTITEDGFFVFVNEVVNADGYTIRVYDENKLSVINSFKISTDDSISGFKIAKSAGIYYVSAIATDSTMAYLDSDESALKEVEVKKVVKNKYDISYVLNGGTLPASAPTSYTEGVGVTLPKASKSGNIFIGWYLNPDFTGNIITKIDGTMIGEIILYACFEVQTVIPTYTITYVLNGGTLASDAPTIYKEGETINLKNPTKSNATFDGWYLNSDFTGERVTVISNQTTGNITLYAKWNQNSTEYTGYYEDANNLDGTALKKALRTIISSGVKTVSYGDLRDDLQYTDADPNDSSRILLVYSHASVKGAWDGGSTWNREHMWPQSQGWFTTSGAGSDIHHLRPEDPTVNSTRGNKPYGNVNGGKALTFNGKTIAHYDSYFEVNDEFKGDVARIIMYLLVRYSESDSYNITNVFQSYSVLLEWHNLDPVCEFERVRNERSYSIQKNRNPFIDHPEFADMIWA